MIPPISFEEFINRCKNTNQFNDFIFIKNTYKNYTTKMKIICKKCNDEFFRKPVNHVEFLYKCANCSGIKRHTKETFIEKSNKSHKNKYDYDKVIYINNKVLVTIKCPIHGDFLQRPDDHMKGNGCFKCCPIYKSNTEDFSKKASTLHNNKYDYSKFKYINNRTKSIIICPIHGQFEMDANGHLLGYGCSKCLYKNETFTGEYIKKIFHVNAKKKTLYINKNGIKRIIVDFYFKWKGITIIIEYNGEQHYKPGWMTLRSNKKKAAEDFKHQQKRDKYLREYCKKEKIHLIEIDGRKYTHDKIFNYLLEYKNIYLD